MPRTSQPSEVRQSLVSYAARILGMRPYFSGKLRQKLQERAQKMGFVAAEEVIEAIIFELASNKFLDDRYLAAGYVRKELRKGWGPRIILLKLIRLGVDRETAQEAILTEADLPQQKEAISHYLKKISRYDPRIQTNKLFQRGFNGAAILNRFDSATQED